MKMLSLHILLAMLLTLPISAASPAYFGSNELIFENGAGWKETTLNITGDETIMQATGKVKLKNGIVLDDTIAVYIKFINESFVGMVAPFASTSIPKGWLTCDGKAYLVNSSTNIELQLLANKLQATWNLPSDPSGSIIDGNWVGIFRVPDLRGSFLRGADSINASAANLDNGTRYLDPNLSISTTSKVVGTYEGSSISAHTGHATTTNTTISNSAFDVHTHTLAGRIESDGTTSPMDPYPDESFWVEHILPDLNGTTSPADHPHSHTIDTSALNFSNTDHSADTYPKNAAVIYGIRY